MTRLEALERVAEAARELVTQWDKEGMANISPIRDELAALDALPTEAPGEMVTLGLMRARFCGTYMAFEEPAKEDPRYWDHIGNLVFVAPPAPTTPTIPATVEVGE